MMPVVRNGFVALFILASAEAASAQSDLSTTLRVEAYAFGEDPLSPQQTHSPSRIALDLIGQLDLSDTLTLSFDGTGGWSGGEHSFEFGRINRLSLDQEIAASMLSFGYDTLIWSKSEFARLSDVINPRDYRFDPSGETTLGQPMFRWDLPLGPGVLTSVVIPRPLPSRYPSAESRLRSRLPVTGDAQFEKDQNTHAFALRYEASIGITDVGIYGYIGPTREAAIISVGSAFAPYYAWVQQAGFDAQVTFGSSAAKLELRHTSNQLDRTGARSDGWAISVGAEHSFFGVFGSPGDITVAVEYAWDERDKQAWQNNQNDLYAGLRWSLQNTADTQFEIGYQQDLSFDTSAWRLGFEHRVMDGLVAKAEAVLWQDADPQDLVYGLSRDSHLRVSFEKSF